MRPVSSLKLFLSLLVLSLLASIVACTPLETTPRLWIDFPKDGTRFDKPGAITVTAHTAASTGVGYIIFSVNSVPYSQHSPAVEGAGFANFTIPWMPTEVGSYSLEVSMYDVNGNFGGSASSRVQIGLPEPDDPTIVSTLITVTPVISDTPTPPPDIPTATYTPTVTSTVAAPITISFYADQISISSGECVQLSWTVENADEVLLDNAKVTVSGTSQVCPTTTREYVLSATRGQSYRLPADHHHGQRAIRYHSAASTSTHGAI